MPVVPRLILAASCIVSVLVATAAAPARLHAQEARALDLQLRAPAPAPKRYPLQILMVDAAGLLAGVAVSEARDARPSRLDLIAATWYGVGAVAAPAVHEAHGNWPIGVGDFGMRLLAPPLIGAVGLLGACLGNHEFDRTCVRDGWAAGSLIGLAGAATADALLFANEGLRPIHYEPRPWYGHQVLIVDGIGYALGIYFATSHPTTKSGARIHPALAVWAIGYTVGFIGAPIVHFTHGDVVEGLASLGTRLLIGPMGALGGLIGYCSATGGAHDCAAHGAQWGLLGGSLATALFDAFVLSNGPREPKDSRRAEASIGPGSLSLRTHF